MISDSNELVIDQGNTFTKLGWFSSNHLKSIERISSEDLSNRLIEVNRNTQLDVLISSVANGAEGIAVILDKVKSCSVLTSSTPLPIGIDYATPETLGADRIANACGSLLYSEHSNKLVIDFGTCVTYTYVEGNCMKGGAISPGRKMRFRALHEYTASLPLVELNANGNLLGKSTQESITSGVEIAMVREIDGMIDQFCKEFGPLSVIITGGDNSYFVSRLKSPIFADPELTLKGLHEILHHIKK